MSAARRWLAFVLAYALAGCASNPTPAGWLPRARDLPTATRGAWIQIDLTEKRAPDVRGELIALDEDRVHVLTEDGLREVSRASIRDAELALYDNNSEASAAGAGGFLSLSHGWFWLLTVWFWVALGAGASRAPMLDARGAGLDSFRKFARFPQGLPDGLSSHELGPLSQPQ